MAASTTKIGIINRGLQLLGQPSITSLTENSLSARAMLRAYDSVLLAELESHVWKFSITRALLAADATPPLFGKGRYFPLPGDFLFLAPEETEFANPQRRDYDIEIFNNTQCIVSGDSAPLAIRYVTSNITESIFSPTFAEALAYGLALATCEAITNSNTKLQNLATGHEMTIRRATRRNDIQKAPTKSPISPFLAVRD